jgi:hypothetical protein
MIGNYGTMVSNGVTQVGSSQLTDRPQAVNINDFARYASRTRSVFVQIVIVPLS